MLSESCFQVMFAVMSGNAFFSAACTAHSPLDWMVIKLVLFWFFVSGKLAEYSVAFTAYQGKILALKRFNSVAWVAAWKKCIKES